MRVFNEGGPEETIYTRERRVLPQVDLDEEAMTALEEFAQGLMMSREARIGRLILSLKKLKPEAEHAQILREAENEIDLLIIKEVIREIEKLYRASLLRLKGMSLKHKVTLLLERLTGKSLLDFEVFRLARSYKKSLNGKALFIDLSRLVGQVCNSLNQYHLYSR